MLDWQWQEGLEPVGWKGENDPPSTQSKVYPTMIVFLIMGEHQNTLKNTFVGTRHIQTTVVSLGLWVASQDFNFKDIR
jgi:hypothetical protein